MLTHHGKIRSSRFYFSSIVTLCFALILALVGGCSSSSTSTSGGNSASTSGGESATAGQEKLKIRIGSISPEGGASWQAINEFKRVVEEELGDKVEIAIYPASQLGTYREMLEQVRNDSLEVVYESVGIIGTWSALAGIETVPYLYKDEEQFFRVWRSEAGQQFLDALAKESGFRVVGPAFRGFRQLTVNKPVKTVEDLTGIKLRVPGIEAYANAWKALGVSPTPVAFEETYTAIQQGVVEGQENPLSIIMDHRFYEVTDYLVLTNHMAETLGFIFDEQWYLELKPEYRAAIEKAALASADWYRDYTKKSEAEMIAKIKEHGVTVIEPDLSGFVKKAAEMEIEEALKPWVERFRSID